VLFHLISNILLFPIQLFFQDNESFQAKFNSLIELNQANRGDLVRSPTREKLVTFLERLQDNHADGDPTSLWYFLTIHDSILHPLVALLKFKTRKEETEREAGEESCTKCPALPSSSPDVEEESKRLKLLSDQDTPT
jgi:hypothetical protein